MDALTGARIYASVATFAFVVILILLVSILYKWKDFENYQKGAIVYGLVLFSVILIGIISFYLKC